MIVVESGGTKSTWVFHNKAGEILGVTTVGLHPRELTGWKEDKISQLIAQHQLEGEKVFFFGAGCESKEAKELIVNLLSSFMLVVEQVETDVFGACLGMLGNQSGVIGILGTGAVAALYDGEKVVQQTSGLGYLLGDEGSGFDIGKRLLKYHFRGKLSSDISNKIEKYFNYQPILHRIYAPDGRFVVAGLTKIVAAFRMDSQIQQLLKEAIEDFYATALLPVISKEHKIHLIGGVAYAFQDEIREQLKLNNVEVSSIEKVAIHSIVKFLEEE